jgi:ComF family protein
MLYALLDLLVPQRCPICSGPLDTDAAGLCDRCAALMLPVRLPTEPPLAAREAAAWFQGPLRHAIHGLKFQNEPWRGRALGFAAATLAPPAAAFDLIVPVPLSRERLRERGYNQALLIARGVSRALATPMRQTSLARHLHGEAQSSKGRDARRDILGAYAARSVEGRRVLLVDDVTTTGATALACAAALMESGAQSVASWSVAAAP